MEEGDVRGKMPNKQDHLCPQKDDLFLGEPLILYTLSFITYNSDITILKVLLGNKAG